MYFCPMTVNDFEYVYIHQAGSINRKCKITRLDRYDEEYQNILIFYFEYKINFFLLHIFIQDLLIFFYKSIHTIKFYATFVVIILADSVKIHRNKLHCSAPNININMYCVFLLYMYLRKNGLSTTLNIHYCGIPAFSAAYCLLFQ